MVLPGEIIAGISSIWPTSQPFSPFSIIAVNFIWNISTTKITILFLNLNLPKLVLFIFLYFATKRQALLKRFFKKGLIEAGCDEAGRGCLAGPVFAASVILPAG